MLPFLSLLGGAKIHLCSMVGGHLREWRLVISRGKGGALIYGDLGWWAGILPSFWDFSF